MKNQITYILFLFIGLTVSAYAIDLPGFKDVSALQHAQIASLIVDTETGDTIAESGSEINHIPASLLKLITTATFLETYGADFHFQTFLEHDGYIKNGVLYGNLYVRGTGDPTLGSRTVDEYNPTGFLNTWVQQVRKAGIKAIKGSVIADASFFDEEATNPAWIWEDIGNYYAPGIMALAYQDNSLNIILKSGAVGTRSEVVKTFPDYPDVQFVNYIHCTKITYDGAFVHGVPYDNKRFLYGSIPSRLGTFGVMGDMPNPPLFLAQDFTKFLRQGGISVSDSAKYLTFWKGEPKRQVIYTHYSPALDTIIQQTNVFSNNLFAEMLFRYMGGRYDKPCHIHNAVNYIYDFWRKKIPGFHYNVIRDGCGLAPCDAVSAGTFVQLLRYMAHSTNAQVFYNSLPVSGERGTIKGVFVHPDLKGRVHAKSGSIENVRNYAGYIDLPNGGQWTFAIMVSGTRIKQNALKRAIEKYLLTIYQTNI